ncbi:hypothetical protein [Tropicibacter alexandrii]|uniref:hypothetical protein n=1 Tax=Tropicibacter alexandrii TaxID=2267683 RepID=UPI001008EB12|nr:hypothetical protein [Tropicibacter alexandrii]
MVWIWVAIFNITWAVLAGGWLLCRWLRRRFADEAFKFELFEAETRDAVDAIIKRKEAEDQ